MRLVYVLLLSSFLLVRAADTPMAGSFAGEWKSESSGNGGSFRMSLVSATDGGPWKCEVTFSLAGDEVKTKMQTCKVQNSQLTMAYDFEVQGVTARSALTGKWDGKGYGGQYQTTVVGSGDFVDSGSWNTTRGK
jgi:hypothetical protein